MKHPIARSFLSVIILACMALGAAAATSFNIRVIGGGPVYSAGETLTLSLTVPKGKVSSTVQLPRVDGLTLNGTGTDPGARSQDFNFFVTPARMGVFVIHPFDIRTDDGQTFHVNAFVLHVDKPAWK